jgi:CRP-like cAMP-binding protein
MSRYVNVLKQADIFYQLTPTQLELIANLCQERIYTSGELIFPEGAGSDELYVIIRGEVTIEVNPALSGLPEEEQLTGMTIATLRRGQSFGEIALVDQGFRSATARAVQKDTTVLILPREKLMLLCDTYPQLGYLLMRNLAIDLALKIRSTDLHIREQLLFGPRKKPDSV